MCCAIFFCLLKNFLMRKTNRQIRRPKANYLKIFYAIEPHTLVWFSIKGKFHSILFMTNGNECQTNECHCEVGRKLGEEKELRNVKENGRGRAHTHSHVHCANRIKTLTGKRHGQLFLSFLLVWLVSFSSSHRSVTMTIVLCLFVAPFFLWFYYYAMAQSIFRCMMEWCVPDISLPPLFHSHSAQW